MEQERRRERRFLIRETALLRIRFNDSAEIPTITENLSTFGVSLRSASSVSTGSRVEVRVQLPTGAELKAIGEVVRVDSGVPNGYFLIAIRCERPFEPSSRQT